MTKLTPSAARARGDHGLARMIDHARATLCRGLRGIEPALGRYDFDGACVFLYPTSPPGWRGKKVAMPDNGQQTFSLGIYRYIERADGGLKRGKVVRRVKGHFGTGADAPERAFEEAERVCEELEAGR